MKVQCAQALLGSLLDWLQKPSLVTSRCFLCSLEETWDAWDDQQVKRVQDEWD